VVERPHEVDINSPDLADAIVDVETGDKDTTPPVEFLTGAAGCGKTFSIRQRIEADSKAALLCATTGIAAVNLNTVTLHSALGLHPDSIDDQFTSGYMRQRMHQIALNHRCLGIDEMSMLRSNLLDMLYTTAEQVNDYADVKEPFGLTLIGDLCQLPPIKEKWETELPWVFNADCWPKFEAATTRLTKNWRQTDGTFLDALNYLRSGNGREGAAALGAANVRFSRALDPNFDGTVILGRNLEVDNYNLSRYWKLKGHEFTFPARRWGKESGGWKNIPDTLKLKVGAYVMVLANDTERDELTGQPMFRWVNGDCGHVVDLNSADDDIDDVSFAVELVRTGKVVNIDYIERRTQQKSAPDEFTNDEIDAAKKNAPFAKLPDGTFYDPKKGFWVRGAINYMPLRLAYATTVHKSQGLTLDRIQVDLRHSFLGASAMCYVAFSRCRTADGLHIVGDPRMVERRCKIDEKVRRWL
jgi:ATP-dependent DNA helicase PIF1